MWQKVNPIGMRVGIMKSRPAEWFAKTRRISADFFVEDIKVRNYLDEKLARSGVAKVVIRKTLKEAEIIIFASKVGVIMWKNGEKIKALEEDLTKKFGKPFKITIKEVRVPELSAKIMAEYISSQLPFSVYPNSPKEYRKPSIIILIGFHLFKDKGFKIIIPISKILY